MWLKRIEGMLDLCGCQFFVEGCNLFRCEEQFFIQQEDQMLFPCGLQTLATRFQRCAQSFLLRLRQQTFVKQFDEFPRHLETGAIESGEQHGRCGQQVAAEDLPLLKICRLWLLTLL